jgi:hypothetical protein
VPRAFVALAPSEHGSRAVHGLDRDIDVRIEQIRSALALDHGVEDGPAFSQSPMRTADQTDTRNGASGSRASSMNSGSSGNAFA